MKMYTIKSAISVILSLCITSEVFAYGDFYKGSKRGWFWFEQQAKTSPNKENPSTPKEETPSQTATEELKQFSAELDDAKAAMIMRPSVANTQKFIKYQNEMFKKADVVSVNWRDAMLVEPELNIARDIPISDTGAKIRVRAEESNNKELLKSFAKKFHLLFFYRSDCIYCTNFAEVLQVFANRYGFQVSAVTIDGKSMEKFPATERRDLAEKFNVTFFPSLFAYSEELGVAAPISQGFLAIDQLETSATYVAEKLKEKLSK